DPGVGEACAGVQCTRHGRIDGQLPEGQGKDRAGVDPAPRAAAVGALEYPAAIAADVECARRRRIDGQRIDEEVVQACVDSAPALTAVGASEDAALSGVF